MFKDIKEYSISPMHMKMRFVASMLMITMHNIIHSRVFEAIWNAALAKARTKATCTLAGISSCTLHPVFCEMKTRKTTAKTSKNTVEAGSKTPKAAPCKAGEIIKRRFQEEFQDRLGLR
jgi:hypothetical protein